MTSNYRGKQDKYVVSRSDSTLRILNYDSPEAKFIFKNQESDLFDSLLEARLFVYLKTQASTLSITVHPKYKINLGILEKSYKPDYTVSTLTGQEVWEAKGIVLADYLTKLSCLFSDMNNLSYHLVFADRLSLIQGFKKLDLKQIYSKVNGYNFPLKALFPKERRFKVYTLRNTSGLTEYNPLTAAPVVG